MELLNVLSLSLYGYVINGSSGFYHDMTDVRSVIGVGFTAISYILVFRHNALPATEPPARLPTPPPQPPTIAVTAPSSFPRKAATFSLLAPLAVFIFSFFAGLFVPFFIKTRA
jgi:hypothetical protein